MGIFTLCRRRKGKVDTFKLKNGETAAGKLQLVTDCFINPTAQVAQPWYYGLISNKNFIAVNESDTMLSHAGWEELVGYDSPTRKEITSWLDAGATGGSVQSRGVRGRTAFYRITRPIGGIQGMFLTTDNEKDGTAGLLYNTALIPNSSSLVEAPNTFLAVVPGDELFLTYSTVISTTPVGE